jgi:LysR family hca operon transcriptional activator
MQAARQVANLTKPTFALGFMIGHDSTSLPAALQVLREVLPDIRVVISTQNSPQLAAALSQGRIDVAFLRKEDGGAELEFRHLVDEPLQVFLSKDHRLAAKSAISVREILGETFISVSGSALSVAGRPPALRLVLDRYLKESGIEIRPSHEVDSLGSVMSLIVSTGGIAILPAYAKTFLPPTVTMRALQGFTPAIDLSVGYRRGNASPILKLFLRRVDELADRISR